MPITSPICTSKYRYPAGKTNPSTPTIHWPSLPYLSAWWYPTLLYKASNSKRHPTMPAKYWSSICHIPFLSYLDISPSCSKYDTYRIENELAYGLLSFPSCISFLFNLPSILLTLSLTWVNHSQDTLCNNLRTTSSEMEVITRAQYKNSAEYSNSFN